MRSPSYTSEELAILREALNHLTIKGIDAPRVAGLMMKIEKHYEKLAQEAEKKGA